MAINKHNDDDSKGQATRSWVPVPDPTTLTTDQLRRELASLKEVIFTRLEGMDRAIVIFNENLTRAPTEVDKQISHLNTLMEARLALQEEKFHSIGTQFKERDVRVEQTAKDTKVAVDAALQAAEKAVGKQNESFALSIDKSEKATMKQIDQQGALIQTTTAGLNDKIDDIKARLTLIEGKGAGAAIIWGGILGAGTLIAIIIGLLLKG